MEASDFWNKLVIRSVKIGVLSLALSFSFSTLVLAQRKPNQKRKEATVINLLNYDNQKLHFGMLLGGFVSRYNLTFNQEGLDNPTQGNATITDIEARSTPGLMVAAILNYRLRNPQWNFRTSPGVGFLYEPSIHYQINGQGAYTRLGYQVSTLELPLYLVYKSDRRTNSRMYFFGGPNLQTQLSTKAIKPRANELGSETELNIRSANLELSYGFGFHFYLSFFNFAPEIRFYHGLFNLHKEESNENLVNRVIDQVNTHRIAILINFEG